MTKINLILIKYCQVNVYFNWNLINRDEDDNKFVDCAIAGNSYVIITNDKHYNVFKSIEFPPIKVMNIIEFSQMINCM